ncbi:MAG: IPTL-CTERM sorting domain-containing protein, partial [Candidatus Dadabacteria bacterium]|nr:IPTL-CTERM sorting domain-containing protein [Candidatus Dadabacteria bacterium]
VNPHNADAVLIGNIGFEGVTGLAFLPDGRLVGSARGEEQGENRFAILIEIDPQTGAGTLIGTIGEEVDGECGRAPDLSLDLHTGTLFATGDACDPGNDDFLQTVNPVTGQGTLIGTYSPFNGGGNGLAISNNGVFFVTVSPGSFATLITVNPNSGAPTSDVPLTLDQNIFVNALAFHPFTQELFGSTVDLNTSPNERSSTLITINTVTGQTTEIGVLPDCFDAIIFRELPTNIPTLSEWGLIAMAGILGIVGIVGFMVIRRRKVSA